jgi:hypothetical protein
MDRYTGPEAHASSFNLPGMPIPMHPPERIDKMKPGYVLIVPWNLSHEITEQEPTRLRT